MKNTRELLALSLLLCTIAGCHTDTPQVAAPEPKTTSAQPATNANPDPNNQDCEAIKDPAQAENCRMLKGLAAAKKKHNSDNAVKHSPGSISQP